MATAINGDLLLDRQSDSRHRNVALSVRDDRISLHLLLGLVLVAFKAALDLGRTLIHAAPGRHVVLARLSDHHLQVKVSFPYDHHLLVGDGSSAGALGD